MATAPRSTTPSCNASGGSSASTAARAADPRPTGGSSRRPARTPGRPARRSRLSIGSSVTTQFCIDRRPRPGPTTCNAVAPCRVRSKLASSRGNAGDAGQPWRSPRACASSATSSRRRPVSGMSATATGTLQGGLGDGSRSATACFEPRRRCVRSWFIASCRRRPPPDREIRASPAPSASAPVLAEPPGSPRAYRPQAAARPAAARATPNTLRATAASSSSRRRRPRARSRRPWRGRRRPRHAPHLLGHRQVAHAHLAEIVVDVLAEPVEQPLADRRAAAPGPSRQSPQHQHQMQHDHVEAARDRVRHAVTVIERRGSRLRHDHAIEGVDVGGSCGSGERGAKSSGWPVRRRRR